MLKISRNDDPAIYIDPQDVVAIRDRLGNSPNVHLRGGHTLSASAYARRAKDLIELVEAAKRA